MRAFLFFGSSVVVLALATAASALVACSSPAPEADSVSEGKATRQTKKGAEFARCWTTNDGTVDPTFRVYSLICRASSAGLKGLETSSVNVDARTVKSSVQSGTPSKTLDQDLVVGRFFQGDFPLKAMVYGYWKLGEFTSTDYRTEVTIADTVTADQPVIVKLPFDSWEVTLLNRLPQAAVNSEQRGDAVRREQRPLHRVRQRRPYCVSDPRNITGNRVCTAPATYNSNSGLCQ